MNELLTKQMMFSKMVCLLMQFAHCNSYQITLGDAYRDPRCDYGSPDSMHRRRLAIDLNLFKDGKYLTSGKYHAKLHDFWDTIGGAERIEGDLNHYSLEHEGFR